MMPKLPADPEYKRFLENYSCDEEKSMANPETLLGEIEAKTRELIGTAPRHLVCLLVFFGIIVVAPIGIEYIHIFFHGSHLIRLITAKRTTPLLEYIKNKKIEKQVIMNEKHAVQCYHKSSLCTQN